VLNAAPLILAGNGAAAVVVHLRVMGVLQRIAVADLIASLVVLWLPPAGEVVVTGGLLVGYWAVLAWVPVPGHHAGLLTPSVNVSGWVDRMVLGSAHMYPAGRGGYDPEGLLGCLSAAAGVLIGHLVGRVLRARQRQGVTLAALMAAGVTMLSVGLAWSHVLPVNKRLWTPSYVVLMSGLATLALALTHLLVDNRARVSALVASPLRVLGMNALVVYAGTELTGAALGAAHHTVPGIPHAPLTYWVWWRWLAPAFGSWRGNLVWAVGVLALWWVAAAALWQRRWLIRA